MLASYWHRQVKLGDMPLDTFRMLQALEWDDPTTSELQALPTTFYRPVQAPMLTIMIARCLLHEVMGRIALASPQYS